MSLPTCLLRWAFIAVFVAVASCSGGDDGLLSPDPSGDDSTFNGHPADTVAPVPITSLTIAYDASENAATIRWTAPWDDAPAELVDRYEIRFSMTRLSEPPDFWDLSIIAPNPPEPTTPGTEQVYVLDRLLRGRDLWVGVRSFDEADNRSDPSNLVSVHVPGVVFDGRVIDAFGGHPVSGLHTRISAGPAFESTTDADGWFGQDDLQPGSVDVLIESTTPTPPYHRINQLFVLEADSSHQFAMVERRATASLTLGGMTTLAFLKELVNLPQSSTTLARWRRMPLRVHFPPLVNEWNVDYAAAATRAIDQWELRTGWNLFEVVAAPPDTGVVMRFRTRAEMGTLNGVTRMRLDPLGHPLTAEVDILDEFQNAEKLFRVMMHELGHTLLLGHRVEPEFIMFVSQPLPGDISADEADVVRLMMAMPLRVDLDIYDTTSPGVHHTATWNGPTATRTSPRTGVSAGACGGLILTTPR